MGKGVSHWEGRKFRQQECRAKASEEGCVVSGKHAISPPTPPPEGPFIIKEAVMVEQEEQPRGCWLRADPGLEALS